jgi:hypothetical protein
MIHRKAYICDALGGVNDYSALLLVALEHVHQLYEPLVKDDYMVWIINAGMCADRAVVDAAESHDRRAASLHPEERES